jgi:hypothetical protein
MTQFNKGIQLELYQKELGNLENAIKESQTILDEKVHPYYSYFINNITLLSYYKKEIQYIIDEIKLTEQIIANRKMVNIDNNFPFTVDIEKSKLIIDTVIRKFSWNVFAQILIVLFIDKKFDESANNLIIPIILEKTILNNKKISKQYIININTSSYDYLKITNFLKEEKKDVTYNYNKLLKSTTDLLKVDKFINQLIKSVNELIELLPISTK